MSKEKAREIIERALADRTIYDAMAARESEVWGGILPALERSAARAEDATASAELRAGRYQSSLVRVAMEKGLKFERGLTLGCGAGRLERALLKSGICQSFHGVDISEQAIADARKIAAQENLSVSYEAADLNFIQLPPRSFDLVVAQTSLHHVLFLEHVAAETYKTLQDGGYLWIHDFIGETQGQYDERRLAIINELLSILPEKFRLNRISGRKVTEVVVPTPGRLGSPFEKIRSEEIIPIFERWFTIEWKREFGAFLHLVAPPGTRAAYVENDDTKALFEVLILLDALCLEAGLVQPTGGQYLMRANATPPEQSEVPQPD